MRVQVVHHKMPPLGHPIAGDHCLHMLKKVRLGTSGTPIGLNNLTVTTSRLMMKERVPCRSTQTPAVPPSPVTLSGKLVQVARSTPDNSLAQGDENRHANEITLTDVQFLGGSQGLPAWREPVARIVPIHGTSRAIWLLFSPAAADRMILPRRANCGRYRG